VDESGGPAVLREQSEVIEVGHSVIVLRTWNDLPIGVNPMEENTLVTVPTDDVSETDVWVNTADQCGPFEVTTRFLDGPPGDLGPEWEDIVEFSMNAPGLVVATEMIDNEPQVQLVDEPGQYRVRVSARGRGADDDRDEDLDDETDDEAPMEWYLLETWRAPLADPVVLRLTSPHAERTLNPPSQLVIPEGTAGLEAAARIGRDATLSPGARTLSGELGSVRVVRTIRGARRRMFEMAAYLTTWSHAWLPTPSWSFSGRGPDPYAVGNEMWAYAHNHADQLSGDSGAIRWRFLEVVKPERAVRGWNWVRRVGDRGPSPFYGGEDVLTADSVITITLQEQKRDGDPWTTLTIEHAGLPVEWLDDMEAYWDYQLSIADHTGLGTKN
jgi:hypothetical protein